MKNLDQIAEDLFNKIRGRFTDVEIGNDEGKKTNDPASARFYDFVFLANGQELGKISVALFDDKLSVIFNEKLVIDADSTSTKEWYAFLNELRFFAKKRMLGFDVRNINKSNLDRRDYKFLSQDTRVLESLSGTSKKSYQKIGNARLNIVHSKPIESALPSSRTRNIHSIFVESDRGERFRYPYRHLNGARAMARHVSEGGTPYDEFGQHIITLNEELSKLTRLKRHMNRSKVMAEGLKEYQPIINDRVKNIKQTIAHMQTETGYKTISADYEKIIVENIPENVETDWVDQLTIKQFNEELKGVFPFLYRLVSEHRNQDIGPEDFFENFV